jgi:hypothetical protein
MLEVERISLSGLEAVSRTRAPSALIFQTPRARALLLIVSNKYLT